MTFDSLIRNIKWRLSRVFFSKRFNEWQKTKEWNEVFRNGCFIKLEEYTNDAPIRSKDKTVICIYDGKIKNGGLADRLRGIVSVYSICKEYKIDFNML